MHVLGVSSDSQQADQTRMRKHFTIHANHFDFREGIRFAAHYIKHAISYSIIFSVLFAICYSILSCIPLLNEAPGEIMGAVSIMISLLIIWKNFKFYHYKTNYTRDDYSNLSASWKKYQAKTLN